MASPVDTPSSPLVVTPGEPAGIGPDLLIQLAQSGFDQPLVALVSSELMAQRAQCLGLPLKLIDWQGERISASSPGSLYIHNVPGANKVEPGALHTSNAAYVLKCLDEAIDGCLQGRFSALVTGPLHKGIINDTGIPFTGHTEHLQHRCGVDKVVMMLACSSMRVALATTHLPLSQVPQAITVESLQAVCRILAKDLRQKFGIARPRILVAGLNPHAGEGGHMGREEIDYIIPALESLKDENAEFIGPLPADTLFTPRHLEQADAALAMYHDQGLPVLKYSGFGEAVNITLGLPMIRTSVDHGTALDLAGTGKADSGSLAYAIETASEMVQATHLKRASTSP